MGKDLPVLTSALACKGGGTVHPQGKIARIWWRTRQGSRPRQLYRKWSACGSHLLLDGHRIEASFPMHFGVDTGSGLRICFLFPSPRSENRRNGPPYCPLRGGGRCGWGVVHTRRPTCLCAQSWHGRLLFWAFLQTNYQPLLSPSQ